MMIGHSQLDVEGSNLTRRFNKMDRKEKGGEKEKRKEKGLLAADVKTSLHLAPLKWTRVSKYYWDIDIRPRRTA